MKIKVSSPRRFAGAISVPGDKSISHRAALFGALATGKTEITGFLEGEDCLGTLAAVRALGVSVERLESGHYRIDGVGLAGLEEPEDIIDCGNSGTTARLLLGVLAGQPFTTVLTGDRSLRRRPMDRVTAPLRHMGAAILGRSSGGRLPLAIRGGRPLRAIHHVSEVASAQVKTAVLLAGLWADASVSVTEPARSRDHTERMLSGFGARVATDGHTVSLAPGAELRGQSVAVPGDISSAAFFLVAGCIIPQAQITISHVGTNATRTGLVEVLEAMGGQVTVTGDVGDHAGEPVGDLTARGSRLRGVPVGGELIPRVIDEVPILAVAATQAEGVTRIRDAAELRVKESDRIQAVARELQRMGASITERPDGLEIRGGRKLVGSVVQSSGDHRMAMALVVAGLAAEGDTVVEDTACVETSFPGFVHAVNALAGGPCARVMP